MSSDLLKKQHKRIVALSAAALVFGFNAVRETAGAIFAAGYADGLWGIGLSNSQSSLWLGTSIIVIFTVVYIMMRSFEDEAAAKYAERHDAVTGLPNRNNMQHKLEKTINKGQKPGALILIDPSRLRSINTTLGRDAGDAVFAECANRLKYFFEKPNFVAVSSNGTLAIYADGIERADTINALISEIRKAIKLPIKYGSRDLYTNMTAAAVLFSSNSVSAEELLNRAELALVEAKASQAGDPVVFNASLHESIRRRSSMETELQEVLELDKLEPFFQPLFRQDGKTLYGFEALARWKHPSEGWVSPSKFIPVAEELKLSSKLGCQIMKKACKQILPFGDLKIAVNVTPSHLLQDGFVELVRDILNETGLAPARLELEITESVFLKDADKTIQRINDLRALGVSIALDDFGTGYSSLSYLNHFDVDRIKIDASFIQKIKTSNKADSMVETIINLAQERGFDVTVEGVETKQQLDFLKQLGNLTYQGYYLSPPLSYEQLVESDLMRQRDFVRFNTDGLSQFEGAGEKSATSASQAAVA